MHDVPCSQDGDQVRAGDIRLGRLKNSHMSRQPWGSLGKQALRLADLLHAARMVGMGAKYSLSLTGPVSVAVVLGNDRRRNPPRQKLPRIGVARVNPDKHST